MNVIFGSKTLKSPLKRSVVTVGNFDGVHLGHREIFRRVTHSAKSIGGASVVMSFDPHPRRILAPSPEFKMLFDKKDLEEVCDLENIDVLDLEPFSRELSQMSPESFINDIIYKPFHPQKMIVGYDFSFGANRSGTLQVLESILSKIGVELEIVPPQKIADEIISSSRIRSALSDGEVELAKQMLGRYFYVSGVVERGDQRGRSIGFPTANIRVQNETVPALGVYASFVTRGAQRFMAVTNVGVNPTFTDKKEVRVETHVLDFSSDIYGETLKVEFVKKIRNEQKFAGVSELVAQIQKDVLVARDIFLKGY